MRTLVARSLCGAVAAALVVATPSGPVLGSESPSRVVLRDGTGDVWKVNVRTSAWRKVGELPAADVTRAVVRHRSDTVVVRVRFVDLRRTGRQTYWTGIETPRDTFYTELVSRRGARAGQLTLFDGPAGARLPCAQLAHRIDYAADLVAVRVPRSCLGTPRWVTANIGNILVLGARPHRRHYADNPHDDGPYVNQGTRRLYTGPA